MPVDDVGAVVVTPIGQGHTPLFCIKINLAAPCHDLHEAEMRCQSSIVPSVLPALYVVGGCRPSTQTSNVRSTLQCIRDTGFQLCWDSLKGRKDGTTGP